MQVSLLPLDAHDAQGSPPHEDAGDKEDPVLQRLPAKIHAEESSERGGSPQTQWNRTL